MRLLSPTHFVPIFAPLSGRKVALVDGIGNYGDHMIYAATRQLLGFFDIQWETWNPDTTRSVGVDAVLLFGGGNLGSCYQGEISRRRSAIEFASHLNLPATILPQSAMFANEDTGNAKIYLRELESLKLYPQGCLAPDLALGLDYEPTSHRGSGTGCFLREDAEKKHGIQCELNQGDPLKLCKSVKDYLELPSRFQHIVTNRLHFAVASLLNNRRTTLMPNSYHKNRSMWAVWLRHLGCEWAENVEEITPCTLS